MQDTSHLAPHTSKMFDSAQTQHSKRPSTTQNVQFTKASIVRISKICCVVLLWLPAPGSEPLSAMAKHPWFWTLLVGLVGLAPWSFLPSKFSPELKQSKERSSTRISRAAVGLSTFSTGAALLEKIDRDRSIGPLEELGCEVRW